MVESVYALGPEDGLCQDLNHFRVILVTGPQRSGTTFIAKAFSHDMSRPYVDETVFGIYDRELWSMIINRAKHCIVQCPSMMRFVHDIPDDVLTVVVRREIGEILESQKRVGWDDNEFELSRYGVKKGVASRVKYNWWDKHKRKGPKHWIELDYASMKNHPLWIDKDERLNFTAKQTEIKS